MDIRITRANAIQFAKFIVVGVVNTAFSYGIYAALVFFGVNYALANLIALIVGILFTFKTQGFFVFANQENRRIVRFVVVWAVIYCFNVFMISRFIAFGFNPYVSGALALPFTTLLSFFAQKFFVFRDARSAAVEP